MISKQLVAKLNPVQQRISLIAQIAESDARIRVGFRDGLTNLNKLLASMKDPDAIRFGVSVLTMVR
jgi:hypothetical protein